MTKPSAIPSTDAYRRRSETTPESSYLAGGRGRHYLHAGQYFASARPTAVSTILGSCVSVCIWDPRTGIGGVNHFVLPHWAGTSRLSPRFASVAISSLVEGICMLGSKSDHLLAKVVGGAGVLGANHGDRLGARNIAMARELLEEEGIPIVAEDVGGTHGRRLIFHTDEGTAWIRRL